MSEFYLIIIVLLFILAISDLVVGVSNDAVNFLNSAIGSKVASRHIIMLVASLGILAGATFSSGMMEVARKGIFNPEFFVFGEIMIIFLAVMITDIILLDLFNTFGLPTSTTVSIVFELLGAAVVVSLIKVLSNGDSLATLGTYINSSQAVLIISGIFLSIIFAFLSGIVVQFISRQLFTFHPERSGPWVAAIWSGLAMSAMTFFLLFKGLSGASFVTESFVNWVDEHLWALLGAAFLIWTIIMYILSVQGINIFRIIVLFGTFSLAMAFAGNDLVNFIGVPIAGFESYIAWRDSGQDAFNYSMDVLQQPIRTKSYLLVAAGLIMIITLWFSKKARSVTDTEVNLGRQDAGYERFAPNILSRSIVRYVLGMARSTSQVLPQTWLSEVNKNYEAPVETSEDKPAFDLVRASVNLTMASVLIAFATSLKLPLSTTYVSFMVAMGTSLADRAWGRDSAVYRVAGVLNVIGGWFVTAFIAFTVSGLFAMLIYHFDLAAIVLLITVAIIFIIRSFTYHRRKEVKKRARLAFESAEERLAFDDLSTRLTHRLSAILEMLAKTYQQALSGLLQEDLVQLDKSAITVREMGERNADLQYELYKSVKRIVDKDGEGSKLFIYVFDLEQDILQSAQFIVDSCTSYVQNVMPPLAPEQIKDLQEIKDDIVDYLQQVASYLSTEATDTTNPLKGRKKALLIRLEDQLRQQVKGIQNKTYGSRNSQLIFKILLESKDLVAVAARFSKIYRRAQARHTTNDQAHLSVDQDSD